MHRIIRIGLFFALFTATASLLFAQPSDKPADYGIKSKKAVKHYLNGMQQASYRDYRRAISLYEEALVIEPAFGDAYFQMGAAYYSLHEYELAYKHLGKAKELISNPHPMLYFYYAESALREDQFQEAADSYRQFMAAKPKVHRNILKTAQKNQKNAEFGAKAIKKAIQFEPVNLGENINTDFEEYLPYLTADGQTMFFTTRRPGCTGGFNREDRSYGEDFYYSEFRDGEWQFAENLGPPVNTAFNEGAATFSPDGQYVYFTACNRKDGYGNCDIYVSKLDGNRWLPPKNLGPIVNSSKWDSQPTISHDGKTLYFSSLRPGGHGQHDIWYTTKVNGYWTEPKNLGAPINTEGSEVSPFLHADSKTLYFASDFHPGFGGYDLFITKNTGDGWTAPENLGYPLNTGAAEGNIFVTTNGDRGYINSSRKGGLGRSDIYEFELDDRIRPNYTTYVRGFVKEKGGTKPLNAKVTFINIATRDTIRAVQTNKATGKFLLTLPLDEDYVAFVDRKGYLFASQFFSLKDIDPEKTPYYDVEIELEPLKVGIDVVMSAVFYETNKFDLLEESKAELEHLVQFMILNDKVRVEIGGHTDDVGSENDNQVLSENRAGEVRKYLISRGIAAERVDAKGYGESQPRGDTSEEGRALNRRTVCKIVGI